METKIFEVNEIDILIKMFGVQDRNIRKLMSEIPVLVTSAGGKIAITGEKKDVELANEVIKNVYEIVRRGGEFNESAIKYAINLARHNELDKFVDVFDETVAVNAKGRPIKCKTISQKNYVNSIRKNS